MRLSDFICILFTWDSPALDVLNDFKAGDKVSVTNKQKIDGLIQHIKNNDNDNNNNNNPSMLDFFQTPREDANINYDAITYIEQFVENLAKDTLDLDRSWLKTWEKRVSDLVNCDPLFPTDGSWTAGLGSDVLAATINDVRRPDSPTNYDPLKAPAIFKLCFKAYIDHLESYDIAKFSTIAREEWRWNRQRNVHGLMKSPILKSGRSVNQFRLDIEELENNKISTIGQLEEKWKKNKAFDFKYFDTSKIETFLQGILSDPVGEECLHGSHIPIDSTAESVTTSTQNYSEGCVNVVPRKYTLPQDNKKARLSIISGPSGSGKTYCAINKIPKDAREQEEDNAVKSKGLCVVYMVGESMISSENDSSKKGDNFDIADFITETVKEALKEELVRKGSQPILSFPLEKTYLALVIDEVNDVRHILKDKTRLGRVGIALKGICESYHVIVCGTGYETISHSLGTGVDALKYDMRPWNVDQFEAKARQLAGYNYAFVVNAVYRSPLLQQLITNGRACQFLIKEIMKTPWYTDYAEWQSKTALPSSYIPSIVACVANEYTNNNGLAKLDLSERRLVAQSILDELRIATSAAFSNTPPKFQKLKDLRGRFIQDEQMTRMALGIRLTEGHFEILEAQALSLMTYNLEQTKEGYRNIRGPDALSVEVSPAITLVLCHILRVSADIYSGWGGFETVVAIDAFFDGVREAQPEDLAKWKISKLPSAMPPTQPWSKSGTLNEYATCEVPIDVHNTVFVNGPRAPYADIIAPGKLIQVKYTTGGSVDVDLVAEVGKAGLLEDNAAQETGLAPNNDPDAFRRTRTVGRAVTSYFRNMWESGAEGVGSRLTSDVGAAKIPSPEGELAPQDEMSEQAATEAVNEANAAKAKAKAKADEAFEEVAKELKAAMESQSAQQQLQAPSAPASQSQSPEETLKAAFEAATAAMNAWLAEYPLKTTKEAESAAAKAHLKASYKQRKAKATRAPSNPKITLYDAKQMFPASQFLHTPMEFDQKTENMKEMKVTSLNFPAGLKNTMDAFIAHQHKDKKGKEQAIAKILLKNSMHSYRTSLSSEDEHFDGKVGFIDPSSAIPLKATFTNEEEKNAIDFIFVTNAEEMVLKFAIKKDKQSDTVAGTKPTQQEKRESVKIRKSDVDYDGKLEEGSSQAVAIKQFQKDFVEDGLNLRFVFSNREVQE